jgi:hypothetical protein
MMALPIFQRTVVTDRGDIIANAQIEVRVESTGALADIYSDRDGLVAQSNPFYTGENGFAQFFAEADEYKVSAISSFGQIDWRYVKLVGDTGGGGEYLELSGGDMTGDIGLLSYTETVFEVTGTTPALSPSNGTVQTWTLSGNSTPTFGTFDAGQSIVLMIDDGSDSTITWPTMTWLTSDGLAPTLATTGFTAVVLWKVGSVVYGKA